MCIGQYIDLRCYCFVVITFYTLVGILSTFLLGVALRIITCPPPFTQGRRKYPAAFATAEQITGFAGGYVFSAAPNQNKARKKRAVCRFFTKSAKIFVQINET